MFEIHIGLVELAGLITGVIFWFARLEFRSSQTEKEIAMLWKKNGALEEQINGRLSRMEQALARLEGFLAKGRTL